MLYSALTPLLPHFVHEFHLSKAGAGVLVAAYAAGALVGGLPGGAAAARLGARRAVLVGLTLMGLASLGFAFAHGFWPLAGARFLQGVGQRLHLGRRLRVAARRHAGRAPRRGDRDRDGRRRVRRAARAGGRSSGGTARAATSCSRRSPASRSCSPSGRCGSTRSRPTTRRWRRCDAHCATPCSSAGSCSWRCRRSSSASSRRWRRSTWRRPVGVRQPSARSGWSAPPWKQGSRRRVGRVLDRRGVLLPIQLALTAAVPISVASRSVLDHSSTCR